MISKLSRKPLDLHLVDEEGKCLLCGRVAGSECSEPDSISCHDFIVAISEVSEGRCTGAVLELLRDVVRSGEIGFALDPDTDLEAGMLHLLEAGGFCARGAFGFAATDKGLEAIRGAS